MTSQKTSKTAGWMRRCNQFFQSDIWTMDTASLPWGIRHLVDFCRIILIVVRGFLEDSCSLQASALTYITLVSLVPILAIMFSFTRGVGLDEHLLGQLGVEIRMVEQSDGTRKRTFQIAEVPRKISEMPGEECAAPNPSPVENFEQNALEENSDTLLIRPAGENGQTLTLIQRMSPSLQAGVLRLLAYVENSNLSALGAIGSFLLIFSVIFSLSKLEHSLNTIWGVKSERPWLRRISEYLMILIFWPVLLAVIIHFAHTLRDLLHIPYLLQEIHWLGILLNALVILLEKLSICAVFMLFYLLVPNTRVKPMAAAVSALFAILGCWGARWAFLTLQVGLSNLNKVYGTFALLPFFLAWLYATWSILLLGAELGYAVQNYRTIHLEKGESRNSMGIFLLLAQAVMFDVCRGYCRNAGRWSVEEFSQERNVSSRLLLYVVNVLERSQLLLRLESRDEKETLFVPGRDPSLITPAQVNEVFFQFSQVKTQVYLRDLKPVFRRKLQENFQELQQRFSGESFAEILRRSEQEAKA